MRLKCSHVAFFVLACVSGCSSAQEPSAEPQSTPHPSSEAEGTANSEPSPSAPAPRDMRVYYDLTKHADRAELRHRRTLVVDYGSPAGAKYTLGGWTTAIEQRSLEGTSVALSTDARGCFYLPWNGEGPATLAVRGRVFRNDMIGVEVNGERVGELRLPADGTYDTVRVTVPEEHLVRGENTVVLRTPRITTVANLGRAGIAVDWMRFGPASESNDTTAPPTFVRNEANQPALVVPPSWSAGYTLEVPAGARLRGRLAPQHGATLAIVAHRDGQASTQLGTFSAQAQSATNIDVPLTSLAGELVQLELQGSGGPVQLLGASIVVPADAVHRLSKRPRNVIVYLVDTWRADKLQPLNERSRVRTPGLGRFVQEAATMTRAHTQENWTKPSVATLLSSLMPWEHTATQGDSVVPASVDLLPEVLAANDFFTGSFIANGYVSDRFGFKQGWNTYRNYIRENRRTVAESVANDVIAWLDARPQDKPFFVYIHTIDPHVPYRPPEEFLRLYGDDGYRGPVDFRRDATLLENIKLGRLRLSESDKRQLEALYDGEITYHDVHFDRILAELKRRNLWDDTMIVLTADHGEEFWDHGSVGHGHNVYEELLHVPLFVRIPGVTDGAVRVDDAVGLVDVMPTVLDALGKEGPEDMSGRSFLRLLERAGSDAPRTTVSGFMDNWRTNVVGRWKIIERARGSAALYDLVADPDEHNNIATAHPIALRYTRGLLGMELARTARGSAVPTAQRGARGPRRHEAQETEIDPETEAQLRALGYVH